MPALKIKEFPGVQRAAPERIEKHETEQALRSAQYALDCQLLDLKNEFLQRGERSDKNFLIESRRSAAGWNDD